MQRLPVVLQFQGVESRLHKWLFKAAHLTCRTSSSRLPPSRACTCPLALHRCPSLPVLPDSTQNLENSFPYVTSSQRPSQLAPHIRLFSPGAHSAVTEHGPEPRVDTKKRSLDLGVVLEFRQSWTPPVRILDVQSGLEEGRRLQAALARDFAED